MSKKSKISVIIVVVSIMFSVLFAYAEHEGKKMTRDNDIDESFYTIVEKYVASNKSWLRDDYDIKFKRREKKILVFWVIYNDDTRHLYPGGGKSFEVHVDQEKMAVVRELAFQ